MIDFFHEHVVRARKEAHFLKKRFYNKGFSD